MKQRRRFNCKYRYVETRHWEGLTGTKHRNGPRHSMVGVLNSPLCQVGFWHTDGGASERSLVDIDITH